MTGSSSTTSAPRCSTGCAPRCARSSCRRRSSSACAVRCATRSRAGRTRRGCSSRSSARTCSSSRWTGGAQWYRYHGLFGELLRRRLELDQPGRARLSFTRARWPGTSIRGRCARRSTTRSRPTTSGAARELVATHWSRYFNRGRLATVRFWLDALDRDAVRGDPRLCAARAWLALDDGRIDEAEPWILAAELSMDAVTEADDPAVEPRRDGRAARRACLQGGRRRHGRRRRAAGA